MEKYIEENDHNPHREEDIRVNKNDIKKKKWSKSGFVTIEEIPEPATTEEDIAQQQQEGETVEDYYERAAQQESYDDTRAYESDKKKIEQLSKELKYREGDGAASVYTEEEDTGDKPAHNPIDWGGEFAAKKEKEKSDEFANIEKDITPRISRRKSKEPITSMSAEQVSRESRDYDKTRKGIRSQSGKGNTGIERDNLKTMPDHKKIKGWRQKIKDFFTKQNNKEAHKGRLEQMYEDYPLDREYQDPTLNGRPMDKTFLEEEDRAA